MTVQRLIEWLSKLEPDDTVFLGDPLNLWLIGDLGVGNIDNEQYGVIQVGERVTNIQVIVPPTEAVQ